MEKRDGIIAGIRPKFVIVTVTYFGFDFPFSVG
jgi:hypothetical protein